MPTLLLTFALLFASAPGRPSHAALRKAFEQNAATLVEVSGGRRSGAGVVVGADGHIITTVDHVGLYDAKVKLGDREVPAKVLSANALTKIAVLSISEKLHAPAVRTDAPLEKGDWLIGLRQKRSFAGQIINGRSSKSPFIITALPLPPGSPLFDARGRLVAVVVERVGKIGSKALPLKAIEAQVAQGTAP